MTKCLTLTKFKIGILLFTFVISTVSISILKSTAVSASYSGSNLIDNAIFLKSNSMSQADIQNFLANKSSYLTNYVSLSGRDGANVSAAQIIYEAAQDYGINPQVILATIQKEQSLVTAQNPLPSQINYAMGYGCPDSGTCSYPGFFNQIANGTWQLRFNYERANGNNTWWNTTSNYACSSASRYYDTGLYPGRTVNFIDDSGAVYTTLTLANAATASLYCYTPHAYSTTSSPPYSGSYNFVNSFESWFGPSTNSHLDYSVIQGPGSSALYLQTSAGKYYIPSGAVMQNWGIGSLPIQQVSTAYMDSFPTGPNLGSLLKDDWNNYFVVENNTLHYVRDPSYLSLWNMNPSDAVQSLGLAYKIPSGNWLGRFVTDASQPGTSYWLIDKGTKHPISDPSMLYQWRYTPDQLTSLSTTYLNSIPTATSSLSSYATDGTSYYVIDTGRKLSFSNTAIKNAYYSQSTAITYASITLSFLPNETASQFTLNSTNGQWFMLEGGKKHYITDSSLAYLWGKPSNQSPTSLSSNFMSTFTDGGNLSYVVQTSSPSAYWLIDVNKEYIPDAATATAWLGQGVAPPVYSNESVGLLNQGVNATSVINTPGSPYTYIMMDGIRHYLSSAYAKSAWGGSVINSSSQLIKMVPEGAFLNYLAQSTSGQAYLLMNSTKYPIDSGFKDVWGATSSTPTVSDATLGNYATGSTLKAFISINGTSYVMAANSQKIPINSFKDTYNATSLSQTTLPNDYFSTSSEASYLVKSSDSTDHRIWLINQGKKLSLSFAQQVSLGYLSRGVQPTTLSPNTLALIPDDTSIASNLVQKSGSGIKLLNFGTALGFPDGNTLVGFTTNSSVLAVAPSVFDNVSLSGSVSLVVTDDSGKYYLIKDGQKHWITNGAAYQPYSSIPRVYLYGTTITSIPDGSPIN